MKLFELLNEDIISNKYGIFYHRTKDDFSNVMKSRFISGGGGGGVGCGEGWYFSSTLNPVNGWGGATKTNPSYLGDNIVKVRVDLRKMFFTTGEKLNSENTRLAKIVHGGIDLETQFKSIGIPKKVYEKFVELYRRTKKENDVGMYDIPKDISKYFDGYIYGKEACLAFLKKSVGIVNKAIPYAISKDNGKTWEALEGDKYKKRAFKLARDTMEK